MRALPMKSRSLGMSGQNQFLKSALHKCARGLTMGNGPKDDRHILVKHLCLGSLLQSLYMSVAIQALVSSCIKIPLYHTPSPYFHTLTYMTVLSGFSEVTSLVRWAKYVHQYQSPFVVCIGTSLKQQSSSDSPQSGSYM